MSFTTDLLKKINYNPIEEEKVSSTSARQVEFSAAPEVPASNVRTARGVMRVKRDGKIDGRNLQRGKPKPRSAPPRGVKAYEHVILRDVFEQAKPGEEYAWEWRTKNTYEDLSLRNDQLTYVYKIASIYGHKVSISARQAHVVIKYVGNKA